MDQVIDYLAEELKAEQRRTVIVKESTKARKAAKRERMAAMLNDLRTSQPQLVAFGD